MKDVNHVKRCDPISYNNIKQLCPLATFRYPLGQPLIVSQCLPANESEAETPLEHVTATTRGATRDLDFFSLGSLSRERLVRMPFSDLLTQTFEWRTDLSGLHSLTIAI